MILFPLSNASTNLKGMVKSLGAQVDIFFTISGLLTTMSFCSSLQRRDEFLESYPILFGIFFGIKKLIRLWPAAIVVAILSAIFSDIGIDPLHSLLLKTLLFNFTPSNAPIALLVTWSNNVEVISSFVLIFVLITFKSSIRQSDQRKKYVIAIAVILISLAPAAYLIFRDSRLSLSKALSVKNNHIPMFFTDERNNWIKSHYNISDDLTSAVTSMSDYRILHGKYLYVPYYSRWTPFFIGMLVAFLLNDSNRDSPDCNDEVSIERKNESLTKPTRNTVYSVYHSLLFYLSALVLLLPAISGFIVSIKQKANIMSSNTMSSGESELNSSDILSTPHFAERMFMLLFRPMFSASFSYLFLYRTLVPDGHPLKLTTLANILSLPVFRYYSLYTYGIYVIHYRILFEILLRFIPLKTMDLIIHPSHGFIQCCCYTTIAYTISLIMSIFMYHYIEQPVLTYCSKVLDRIKNMLLSRIHDSNSKKHF